MTTQTKSKKRVRDHGEVFTAEREVKAMCDLVKDECDRIDSRFLEPACGDGNFLAEILTRKLVTVRKKYGKSHSDYEKKRGACGEQYIWCGHSSRQCSGMQGQDVRDMGQGVHRCLQAGLQR